MSPKFDGVYTDDFHEAPRRLLDVMSRLDSIYKAKSFSLNGWYGNGIGASAVLRATAQLLKSGRSDPDTRNNFGKIIHVDCSLWKNRRVMQRAIAEELKLGHLMSVFDKQDEDDDFRGIDVSSRIEIPSIATEINVSLRYEKFIFIFHYGGEEDIDLAEFGIPNPDFGPYALGKLLWTSHGRFQLSERKQIIKSNSAYFRVIYLYQNSYSPICPLLRQSLHEEAAEVIGYVGMDDINPAIVSECFLYSLFHVTQLNEDNINVDYGWETHACNYWICDGILQGDGACEVGSALYGVIQMFCSTSFGRWRTNLDGHRERSEQWISVYSKEVGIKDISTLTVNVTSYFLTFAGDGHLQLPNDLFGLASNLHVLKLYRCSFEFASPPFRCCHNLRFIWLDHCTNTRVEQAGGRPCFKNLLVLDIRFTEFVFLAEMMTNLREFNSKGVSWTTISHAWKNLHNLQKLRLTDSLDVINLDTYCSSIDMMNLELFDLSGNIHMESLPTMSSAKNLKMLALDGCSSLQHVALKEATPLLESFSFDGYGPAKKWTHPIMLPKKELRPKSHNALVQKAKVRRISLEGCARLRNVFFRALPNLEELNLSSTAIEILDLVAMDAPGLKKLFLLGCEKLRCLIWDGISPSLKVLHVDTRAKTGSVAYFGEQCSSALAMAFTDGRFVWRLPDSYRHGTMLHLHISSKINNQVSITKSIGEIGPIQEGLVPIGPFLPYMEIVHNKDIITCSSLVWDHPQLYPLGVHIEIGEGSHHLESLAGDNTLLNEIVKSLHVHDNVYIRTIILGSTIHWNDLKWCHVERCPKMHTVFRSQYSHRNFQSLSIFYASDLLMAYCIWGRCNLYPHSSFCQLEHIYLHNCPRLVFVFPIAFTLPRLQTIQIAYCCNLQHIIPMGNRKYSQDVVASCVMFGSLKHIKLYHLHKLEQICEDKMIAPVLETISLRDCWALRRLPAVSRQGPKPVVDCEKDWWDRLEWDGSECNHEPSLFARRHSAYYKKRLPRVSVLR